MKKMMLTALVAMFSLAAFCGTPDEIFEKFRSLPKAEYVHVPKLLLKMGTAYVKSEGNDAAARIASKLTSVRVLDLEDCSKRVKADFAKDISGLKLTGYESLLKANGDGERVEVLIRQQGSVIHEMLIVNSGDDDCQLVQLKGKISQKDIDQLVKSEWAD
ncbi:MAG: DUF4252 domain-containing protein [Prevotella sp.]